MTEVQRGARTQGERSAAMQRRLLDATVSALCEKGYGGTTTLEVQERAGVSRGALLHHYGSRAELIVAAVEHLGRERMAEVLTIAQNHMRPENSVDWAVRVLWTTFEGPLFAASLELWLAARNDAELLAVLQPQERIVGQAIRSMAAELFGQADPSPAFRDALALLFDAMRGAAARASLRTEGTDDRLIGLWVDLMARALE
ncbi:MAG: TetR/AcrR family transcriptional regulator [Actinomycetota bacterium]|nr:TetR/AcrR family transcriptional regulator [Actinomycetota bacterium]